MSLNTNVICNVHPKNHAGVLRLTNRFPFFRGSSSNHLSLSLWVGVGLCFLIGESRNLPADRPSSLFNLCQSVTALQSSGRFGKLVKAGWQTWSSGDSGLGRALEFSGRPSGRSVLQMLCSLMGGRAFSEVNLIFVS